MDKLITYSSRMDEEPKPVNLSSSERIASIVGGVALGLFWVRKLSLGSVLLAAGSGVLLYRGLTGFCLVNAAIGRNTAEADRQVKGTHIRTSVKVDRPRSEVYAYWRKLENLPNFMRHLSEVRQIGEKRSEWSAPIPGIGGHIEWEARLDAEEMDRRLAWRSVEKADIENEGEVRFEDSADGNGTVVHASIAYRPPAGPPGQVARLLSPLFTKMVRDDLRRFKDVMEAESEPRVEKRAA